MALLTRPILEKTAAFDATKKHTFNFNYIGGAPVVRSRLIVVDQESGQEEIVNEYEGFNSDRIYVLDENKLKNNHYYKAFLQTSGTKKEVGEDLWSERSNTIQFRCFTTPLFGIIDFKNDEPITTSLYKFDFGYKQIEGEKIASYKFYLLDDSPEENVLQESEDIFINTEQSQSIVVYRGVYITTVKYPINNIVEYNNKLYITMSRLPKENIAPDSGQKDEFGYPYWNVLEDSELPLEHNRSYKGEWNIYTKYNQYDIVNYSGSLYFAKQDVENYNPAIGTNFWKKLHTLPSAYIGSHIFYNFGQNATYKIYLEITTENGTLLKTKPISFLVKYLDDSSFGGLKTYNQYAEGDINIDSFFVEINGESTPSKEEIQLKDGWVYLTNDGYSITWEKGFAAPSNFISEIVLRNVNLDKELVIYDNKAGDKFILRSTLEDEEYKYPYIINGVDNRHFCVKLKTERTSSYDGYNYEITSNYIDKKPDAKDILYIRLKSVDNLYDVEIKNFGQQATNVKEV